MRSLVLLGGTLVVAAVLPRHHRFEPGRARPTVARAAASIIRATGEAQGEEEGAIGVRNSIGRSGAYYLPSGPRSQPVPLLVALHATGGAGAGIIPVFRALAQARHFAIIAPDSRRAPTGEFTWEVGDHPGEVTEDLTHTLACIEWVRTHTRLVVDPSHVLIAGYSGGGSTAPYVASNRPSFTHLAVLHGGVFPRGIGPRRMPAWFSTSEQDPLRPVALVRQSAAALSRAGFSDVTFRAYPGGHELGQAEARDLVRWWLGP